MANRTTSGCPFFRRLGRAVALALLGILVIACSQQRSANTLEAYRSQGIGPNKVTPEQIQSALMGFTDTLINDTAEASDRIVYESASPLRRAEANAFKLGVAMGAVEIAASANPVVALVDMTVLVTLLRVSLEDYYVPEVFQEEGEPLLAAMRQNEKDIWTLFEDVGTQLQASEIRDAVERLRQEKPELRYVSHLRLAELGLYRQTANVATEESGNLLSLLQVDPLKGLTPAAREIARSRLLAERAFFTAQRLPIILSWTTASFAFDMAQTAEARTVLDATERVGDAMDRTATAVERWPEDLSTLRQDGIDQAADRLSVERQAAIDQAAAHLSEEREAAITQFFDEFATERQNLLDDLDAREAQLGSVMGELRATVDASTQLVTALDATVQTTAPLLADVRAMGEAKQGVPDETLDKLRGVQEAADAITATVVELRQLVASVEPLVAPLTAERAVDAPDPVKRSLQATIDHLFVRSVQLVLIFFAAMFVVLLTLRLVGRRKPDARREA